MDEIRHYNRRPSSPLEIYILFVYVKSNIQRFALTEIKLKHRMFDLIYCFFSYQNTDMFRSLGGIITRVQLIVIQVNCIRMYPKTWLERELTAIQAR